MPENTDLYDAIRDQRGPTKRCGACGTDHPIEAFAFKSKTDLKLHGSCRKATNTRHRAAYDRWGDSHRDRVRNRKATLARTAADVVDAWLAGKRCTSCGSTERLSALGPTGTSLRRMVKVGWSISDIEAELPNATVRCLPCGVSQGRRRASQ